MCVMEPVRQPTEARPEHERAVDETRLRAGLRRTPRERLDHAVQVARVMQRFRGAKRIEPLLAR